MKFLLVLLLFVGFLHAERKYRSDKINYIYDKALQHISDMQRLAKLEKDLSGYDGIYMDTKNRFGSGKVDNLNKEIGKIDKKLINILEKYGLENTIQAFKEKTKHKNTWEYTEENLELPSDKFTDEKLQKLWHQAQNGKFSQEELLELHKELKEVERKMAVYEDHLEEFSKVPHENSLHFDHHEEKIGEKTKKLKRANKELNEHLEKVHQRITNEEYSPFSEFKVKRLWKLAQENENFSMHDLNVLKEELSHFENQLKKIDFHQKEIDTMREMRNKEGKAGVHNIEGAELDARHELLNRKVRKMFDRVLSQFSRKRVASEGVVAQQQQLADKTNLYVHVQKQELPPNGEI
ncbi:unnamed protein product [Caenorhabditis bovis]|uniref:Alpha-2-macroglobulin RAP C-terminal domain-containing protein n=1 Tax=Caenorhabditis bovis TaxID=2654633 RepID=A0A8S1E0M3_9PELO|nr:unnamed protein product [Caenorhabditis bovis]